MDKCSVNKGSAILATNRRESVVHTDRIQSASLYVGNLAYL